MFPGSNSMLYVYNRMSNIACHARLNEFKWHFNVGKHLHRNCTYKTFLYVRFACFNRQDDIDF